MEKLTCFIPGINCGHCTKTIESELMELPGVKKVVSNVGEKKIEIQWEPPTTWEKIKRTLIEINFPPKD